MSNYAPGSTAADYESWSGRDAASCDHCGLYTCNCTCRFCDAFNDDGTPCENLAWDCNHDGCPKHEMENALDELARAPFDLDAQAAVYLWRTRSKAA